MGITNLGMIKMTTPKVAWEVRVNRSNQTKNLIDLDGITIFHL